MTLDKLVVEGTNFGRPVWPLSWGDALPLLKRLLALKGPLLHANGQEAKLRAELQRHKHYRWPAHLSPAAGIIAGHGSAPRSPLLEWVYRRLRELPGMLKGAEDVRSVVVFGSAARPEDFVEGVSDVDVLVLVAGEPRRRHYTLELEGQRVDVVVLRAEELVRLAEEGDPLAFMVKRGLALVDDGTFSALKLEPRVTERTLDTLRRSALAALGLALENLLKGASLRAVHHAYHAVRHAARYKAALTSGYVPISDKEVSSTGGATAQAFITLASMRRRQVSQQEAEQALELAVAAVAAELGLAAPKLSALAELEGEAITAWAREEGGELTFTVVCLGEKGERMHKLTARGLLTETGEL